MNQNPSQIILIYYKFRGQMQPIRNLLCYLYLPFFEIHLEFLQQQKPNFTKQVKQQLKGVKIDRNNLPSLYFQGYSVHSSYPIMNFLCRRFNREDLLGVTLQQKSRLQELLENYYLKQPTCMNELSRLADLSINSSQQDLKKQLKISFHNVMNGSKYIREICQFIDIQLNPKYILGSQMTILDLLFVQTCNYMLGLFNKCDEDPIEEAMSTQAANQPFKEITPGRMPNIYYLKVMREFRQRIQKMQFYQKHQHSLNSFSIISGFTSPQRSQGLRKIWLLQKFFVS